VIYEDKHYVGVVTSGTVLDMICPVKFVHPNSPAAQAPPCLLEAP
jgi:hypothetical protein